MWKEIKNHISRGARQRNREIELNTSAKDIEIRKLQMTIQHLSKEDRSVPEELRTENVELNKRVSTLTDDVLSLNSEIKLLTKELLHCHAAKNNKMALLLPTLFPSPSPI